MNFYEIPEFWLIQCLITIVAIASIRLGYHFGAIAEAKRWTEEVYKDFKEKYFASFCEKFEQSVEAKSSEIASMKVMAYIEKLPEEQQKWFDNYHKEINNDNTETGI